MAKVRVGDWWGGGAKGVQWTCPGCNCRHQTPTEGYPSVWTWNGSIDAPTLSPSVLVTRPSGGARCHCFIVDGQIQFLGDCTHALAGQTVPMDDLSSPDASPTEVK